jgi:hypothetical protein
MLFHCINSLSGLGRFLVYSGFGLDRFHWTWTFRVWKQCIIPFHGGEGGGYIFLIKDTAWTWTPKINCHIEGLGEYQRLFYLYRYALRKDKCIWLKGTVNAINTSDQMRSYLSLHNTSLLRELRCCFIADRQLVDGTVKSVWIRQVFGLLRVWFRQVSLDLNI